MMTQHTPGLLRVDVLDPYGTVLLRIVTTFAVNNLVFAGPDYKQLWLVGVGGVSRVNWDLEGMSRK